MSFKFNNKEVGIDFINALIKTVQSIQDASNVHEVATILCILQGYKEAFNAGKEFNLDLDQLVRRSITLLKHYSRGKYGEYINEPNY